MRRRPENVLRGEPPIDVKMGEVEAIPMMGAVAVPVQPPVAPLPKAPVPAPPAR
jgi:hypothetical protein